jgi:hypothetical protein
VNCWWNTRYQVTIVVVKDKQGRARFYPELQSRLAFTIRTMDAAVAWPIEAEQKALKKLSSLIPQEQFDLYLLTGHFPEVRQGFGAQSGGMRQRPERPLGGDSPMAFRKAVRTLANTG